MFEKARLFGDYDTADQILGTDVPWQQKRLGRQVRNFNETIWKNHREEIVKAGNRAKFTQHLQLREALFATAGTTLVEASPEDCIWGIGLSMDDPRKEDPANWRGLNLLGKILTELREELLSDRIVFKAASVTL